MGNNCQDFAVALFLTVCNKVDSSEQMTQMLSAGRFFQDLLTIKEEERRIQDINGNFTMARFKQVLGRNGYVILEYRLDRQEALVYSGPG